MVGSWRWAQLSGATHLVLWDINLAAAKAVAKEVEGLGASALAMSVDVSKK